MNGAPAIARVQDATVCERRFEELGVPAVAAVAADAVQGVGGAIPVVQMILCGSIDLREVAVAVGRALATTLGSSLPPTVAVTPAERPEKRPEQGGHDDLRQLDAAQADGALTRIDPPGRPFRPARSGRARWKICAPQYPSCVPTFR